MLNTWKEINKQNLTYFCYLFDHEKSKQKKLQKENLTSEKKR